MVDIEVRSNHDYLGPLFIGSGFSEASVIYDTMADWTIVMTEESNAAISGNYKTDDSTSSQAVKNMTLEELGSVNQGSV